MDSTWCISTPSGDVRLVLAHTASNEARARALPAQWVTSQLERWGVSADDDTFLRYRLQPVFEALYGRQPGAIATVTMCRAVVDALRGGRLIATLVGVPAIARTWIVGPREEPVEAAADDPREEKALEWIEIELVDEDGEPVGNQRYRVELPDGSIREGRLNARGFVRIDRVDPGTCKVMFPDHHKSSWSAA
jgi:hypothetical protein